jgi:hypothetical protein
MFTEELLDFLRTPIFSLLKNYLISSELFLALVKLNLNTSATEFSYEIWMLLIPATSSVSSIVLVLSLEDI